MINASIVWILVVLSGQLSTTVAPVINPLYATEKEATCEAQKKAWVDRLPPIYKERLVCLPHSQKDFDPMLYRL